MKEIVMVQERRWVAYVHAVSYGVLTALAFFV